MAVHALWCPRNPDKQGSRSSETHLLIWDPLLTLRKSLFFDPFSDTSQGDGLCRSSCNTQEKVKNERWPSPGHPWGAVWWGRGSIISWSCLWHRTLMGWRGRNGNLQDLFLPQLQKPGLSGEAPSWTLSQCLTSHFAPSQPFTAWPATLAQPPPSRRLSLQ